MTIPDPEIEKRDLAREYRRLLRGAQLSKGKEDRKRIRKAWELAVEAHKDMRRRSGEAYIFHPIAVARICAEEMGLDTTSIVCALLHDTVEDTWVTLDDIERMFGKRERVIIDGLTKNWRYPGWRVAWTVGPRHMIDALSSAGSFLDGGGSRPAQNAALPLLTEGYFEREVSALKGTFAPKREVTLKALKAMGVKVDRDPEGTFYVWGDVSSLPSSINTGMSFFREALKHKVICVPGEFFDINPGQRRADRPSRFRHHVRFSFGPELRSLEAGLARLKAMVEGAR